MNTALVVGGNGITGRHLTQRLETTGRWAVIVTSHSALQFETSASLKLVTSLSQPSG